MPVLDLTDSTERMPSANTSEQLLANLVSARGSGSRRRIAAAEEAVVLEFLPVATRIALRLRGRGVEVEDLIQLARVGLVKAVRGWRPQPTGGFLQYAGPKMLGEVQQHIRDRAAMIRVPRRLHDLQPLLLDARSALERTEQVCTPAALARAANVTIEDAREHLASAGRSHPLSIHYLDNADDRADLICTRVEHERETVEDLLALRAAVRELDDQERHLLALRFFRGRSQQEIAREIGVSQMHVSRLLSRIFAKLRTVLSDDTTAQIAS